MSETGTNQVNDLDDDSTPNPDLKSNYSTIYLKVELKSKTHYHTTKYFLL